MGLISSKLAPMAVKLAWICQRLLDPKYSIEYEERSTGPPQTPSELSAVSSNALVVTSKQQQQQLDSSAFSPESRGAKSASSPPTLASKSPENNNSQHQENRNRRAMQLRYKTRPSSFDAALIIRSKAKGAVIVAAPKPNPLRVQDFRMWDLTSSSGCSSDSCSNSDSDSETELRVSENVSNNEESSTKLGVTAEEEAAFRLTVGRGHFTRSKKDRFLNHLRLEKRLNDLNNMDIICHPHHRHHSLQRRYSGDLHRIV